MDEFIIGTIGKSHGVQGFAHLRSLSGETEHIKSLSSLTISYKKQRKTLVVESMKSHAGGSLLVKFKGIDNPEDVRRYSGWNVIVPRKMGASLKKDEHYIEDLKGCVLVSSGRHFGAIRDILDGPGCQLVEVEYNGTSFLVPYEHRYFGRVDLSGKTIELLTPWLLE